MSSVSAVDARRIALAAQGFAGRARATPPREVRQVARVLDRLGVVQLDSVNVLVRSHYLPLFSRLGPYATKLLDRAAYGARRTLFEYWGHEASLLPVTSQPLLRWRMERAQRGEGMWRHVAQIGRERRPFVARVLAEIRDRGALGAADLTEGGRGSGSWWGWSAGKAALEWLFWTGEITTASRRNFARVYDLTERVLPAVILATPTPSVADAHRALVGIAARALGVATARDLRDYFRLPAAGVTDRIAELVDAGELVPVTVEGWTAPAYLHARATCPRRIEAQALLSPFDSLVWDRQRTERVFGFRYRIGIYTPAHLRTHGYYVLPFLFGDRLVARVDLKADRAARALRVIAAHPEPGVDLPDVAAALARELATMATWLGLARIVVGRRGGLTRLVGASVRRANAL